MSWMFSECLSLIKIEFINIDTSQVNNMCGLFDQCYSLQCFDLSKFDSSKVENMRAMFNECYKLIEIKGINNFNTNKITNMS